MDIGILLQLRGDAGRVIHHMRESGIDLGDRGYQIALGMKSSFRDLARFLPVRRCEACGLQTADATEWGYEMAATVCTEHPSAWM